ncbi:zinc ribbon domain-containing protein [Tindallia californiensis]|uniref:Zinc-ribbon domain-containing protein n=1 Tax=Tindallia californiensis TaxID=159292 RepID=A0A1H3LQU2_9FIRM|nr:zinc ribbon domain-containing protein [Tindallia californiensis]SDY66937.1 hypothetical protein SAMN05192546_103332 [Tindallia californiensis]
MNQYKKISPSLFGLVLICFLLPFITVSCEGETIARLSGVELMTGSQVGTGFAAERVDPSPEIVVTVIVVVVGLIAAISKKYLFAGIAGAIGVISLLMFRSRVNESAMQFYPAIVRLRIGYWLALLLLIGAGGIFLYYHFADKNQSRKIEEKKEVNPIDTSKVFCTQCGSQQEATDIFCTSCGAKKEA